MTELATNPQGDDAVADDQDSFDQFAEGVENDAQDTDDTDDAADDDGQEPDEGQPEAADDGVEVEYEGKTFRVPAEAKDALLRHADYTQKTQAIAATRQELEQRQQAFVQQIQAHQATAQERTQLAVLDHQLSQYTPEALRQIAIEQPEQLPLIQLDLQALRDQRTALAGTISQKEAQTLEQQRQQSARQLQQSHAALQQAIPDWNDQLASKINTFGQTTYGFTPDELGQVADHRMVTVLNDARQWREHQANVAKAAKVAKAQKTAPVQTARGQSGRFSAPPDTTDFAAFEKLAAKG